MRLSESKIKEAILHPNADIRSRAVHYFADSFSQDTSVVPLVIQAVEQYGREEAYHLIGATTELAHTGETISWVVDELDREDADRGPTNVGKLFPPLNPGTATKHVGRNDPCPCGSDKKFKKCCMKKQGDEHLFN